jgi:PleD family two-component response regulator
MSKLIDILILYVEDEETVRESVERSLKLMVKSVISVSNGELALEYINSNHVDVIVTDIRMPKLDGLSMVSMLHEKGFDIPVIVTSAYNDVEFLSKAIELHIDKFVTKPIRISALMLAIEKISEVLLNKKMIEQKVSELRRYREIIEQTNLILYADVDRKVFKINKEICDYLHDFGVDCKEIQYLDELFGKETVDLIYRKVLNYEVASFQVVLHVKNHDFSVLLTAFASIIDNDDILEITFLLKDITSVLEEKDRLINSLYTDTLTNLPNRQKLFHDVNTFENQHRMMIIDIDNFSKINYLYGFESGDEVLKQLAILLQEKFSEETDYKLYRSDKDHFVITSPKIHSDIEVSITEMSLCAN